VAECECSDWYAVHDSMPPEPPGLRVTAKCTCARGGCELTLVRQEPQGINPRDLLLRLEEKCPEVGTTVMTEVEVRYCEEAEVGQFDTVSILPDGPMGLPIENVS